MLQSLTHEEVCNTPMQTKEMPSAYEYTMQETTNSPVESTSTSIFKESIENTHPSKKPSNGNNMEDINDNRSKAMYNIPRNIYKMSLGNINLSKLDFSPVNLPGLKRLLYNEQNEIRALQRKMKSKRMKIYRHKQRVKCVKSLVSHMKQRKYVSDKLSDILEEVCSFHHSNKFTFSYI
ncbi:uncharacterized protein LOC116417310 [Nasonia vitripennis]|uniref:Uncharacterized protein n=1 Tax=Nasonia vitripennis TaxID=7425 RepID=A0A7M7QFA8_NASVI|nr:uncharacterized protein LOC116417310 [Nasonia vitripennis]